MSNDKIEEIVKEFKDNHAFYTSADEYLSAVDWLRTALTEAFQDGRDIGMKADNVLRKEGYDKALEDVRVLIARHAKDDIDVPALVEDINNLKL